MMLFFLGEDQEFSAKESPLSLSSENITPPDEDKNKNNIHHDHCDHHSAFQDALKKASEDIRKKNHEDLSIKSPEKYSNNNAKFSQHHHRTSSREHLKIFQQEDLMVLEGNLEHLKKNNREQYNCQYSSQPLSQLPPQHPSFNPSDSQPLPSSEKGRKIFDHPESLGYVEATSEKPKKTFSSFFSGRSSSKEIKENLEDLRSTQETFEQERKKKLFLEETRNFLDFLLSERSDGLLFFSSKSFPPRNSLKNYGDFLWHNVHFTSVIVFFRKKINFLTPFFYEEENHSSSPFSVAHYHYAQQSKQHFLEEQQEKKTKKKPPFFSLWWHSLDHWIFFSMICIFLLGLWLIMAISPIIALQHHWSTFVLLKRHGQMMIISLLLLMGILFSKKSFLTRGSWILLSMAWLGSVGCLEFGQEIKGARRWLSLGGFTLQPSEFLKPALSLVLAQILSLEKNRPSFFVFSLGFVVVGFSLIPLFLQPDLGTLILLFGVSMAQFFAAGLPWIATGLFFLLALGALGFMFLWFPHAAYRLAHFLSSEGADDPFGDQYQILQGLKSFTSGGWLGKGPGAGTYFHHLPDGHADFIFAVAGEEFGIVVCCLIVGLYSLIVFRSLYQAMKEEDSFSRLSLVGLCLCFGFQVIINLSSVLRLMPTKGMTLPFMSYGGSSLMATSLILGLILTFGRRYRWLF